MSDFGFRLHHLKILHGFEHFEAAKRRGRGILFATAHLGKAGDLLVIMTFTSADESVAATWKPRTATLAERNRRIVRLENPEVPVELLTTFQR